MSVLAEYQPEPWFDKAACRGLSRVNYNVFFPNQGENTKQAKSICDACSVQFECQDYADRNRIGHGVWGGSIRQR